MGHFSKLFFSQVGDFRILKHRLGQTADVDARGEIYNYVCVMNDLIRAKKEDVLETSILIKLLVVAPGAFVAPVGLGRLFTKRLGFLGILFGMRAERSFRVAFAAVQHLERQIRPAR